MPKKMRLNHCMACCDLLLILRVSQYSLFKRLCKNCLWSWPHSVLGAEWEENRFSH